MGFPCPRRAAVRIKRTNDIQSICRRTDIFVRHRESEESDVTDDFSQQVR